MLFALQTLCAVLCFLNKFVTAKIFFSLLLNKKVIEWINKRVSSIQDIFPVQYEIDIVI